MSSKNYDLAIIGAGASGLIAADFAVQLGARVALLEKDRIGGDCTWTGCVPSKSLLKAAKVAHNVRTSDRFGIASSAPAVDMARVREYLRGTISQIYAPTAPDALRQKGLDVILGPVRFDDGHTLHAGSQQIKAKKILINTGAGPRVPPIPGLNEVPYLTYRTVFDVDTLPRTLLVIGGGPVGCELAQAFRRLGAEVTLIAGNLLPNEEPEASAVMKQVFEDEGICVLRARATSVRRRESVLVISTTSGELTGDVLLVAAGRVPSLADLALEAAKVRYTERGITVNRYLQTTADHIYAAGDVIGGPQYSHLAGWQGFQAVRNALLPGRKAAVSDAMPRVTFTSPEVAQAGLTEGAARKRHGRGLHVRSFDISKVDRAVSEDDRLGLIKIIARPNGAILGATIVGERAGEAITEISLAIEHGLKLNQLAATIHPYPTYSTGLQLLATQMSMEMALCGRLGTLIRTASRFWR